MRHLVFPRTLLFGLIACLFVFLVQAPLLAGPINDPRISIGGVPDPPNVPGFGSGFSFTTTTGYSGIYGSTPSQQACVVGGVTVAGCIFVNNTGHTINNLFVSIPLSLQGSEAFSCVSSSMFNCTEVFNSNQQEIGLSFTAASNSTDGDDTSLTDGDGGGDDYIQISVGPLSGSSVTWPTGVAFSVSAPEPPADVLMLSGLALLAMAGWFERRRRATA
jgi:hypothetical protein